MFRSLFAFSSFLKLFCSLWNRTCTRTDQAEQVISAPSVSISLCVWWEWWNFYKGIEYLWSKRAVWSNFTWHISVEIACFLICVNVCTKRCRTISTHKLASYFEGLHLCLVINRHSSITKLYQRTSRRPMGCSKEQRQAQLFPGFYADLSSFCPTLDKGPKLNRRPEGKGQKNDTNSQTAS